VEHFNFKLVILAASVCVGILQENRQTDGGKTQPPRLLSAWVIPQLTLQKFDESLEVNNLCLQLIDDLLLHFGRVNDLTNGSIYRLPQLISTEKAIQWNIH